MAERDVTIDATWRDKTGPGTSRTSDNLRKVKANADGMRGALSKVSDDWGRGITRLGQTARRWADSGDGTAKRWTRGLMGGLSGLASVGGKIGAGLSSAVDAAGPHVKVAMVGVLAAAAVAATPAIGAAIVGGAAGGGILGGVLLAAGDARVKAAFAGLGDDVQSELQDAAAGFVPATLNAVDRARVAFQGLMPDIRRIFNSTSGLVGPLVTKLGTAAQMIVRGVANAVEKAGPIVGAIGDAVIDVADAIGQAFTDLSDNGESMALALRGVGKLVASSIRLAATALNTFIEVFEKAVKMLPGGEHLLRSMSKGMDDAGGSAERLSGGFQAAADDAEAAAAGMTKVKEAADALVDSNLSYREAQIAAREATIEASKTIAENGRAHGLASEKGRENEKALIAMASAYNLESEKAAASAVTADVAAAAYQRNRKSLIDQAMAAGYTRQRAAELADQYLRTPATINTQVRLSGAQQALNNIQSLRAEAERFQGTYTATMRLNYVTYGKPYSGPAGIGGSQYRGYADTASWAPAGSGGGSKRTGGPTPVESNVAVSVNLDGAPFYAMTATAVSESERRQAWRAKVGRR